MYATALGQTKRGLREEYRRSYHKKFDGGWPEIVVNGKTRESRHRRLRITGGLSERDLRAAYRCRATLQTVG